MDDLHRAAFLFLITVNVLTFLLYGWDKFCAARQMWRVPEKFLLLAAVIGGSVGALAGMMILRHKTQHLKFSYGLPIILVLQIVALVYLHL